MRFLTTVSVLGLLVVPAMAQVATVPAIGIEAMMRPTPVSQIKEKDVYNLRGEELGEVERVVLGQGNQIFAVIEFGGFLGLGEERRIVPLSAMSLREDRVVLPGMTEAEFKALPVWRGDAGYRELENTYAAPFRTYTGAATAGLATTAGVNDATGAIPTQWTYQNIDADKNLELTDREFTKVSRDVYGRWDKNSNARLETGEFYGGLYGVWDANDDGRLAENEFTSAWGRYARGLQPVGFGAWDRNSDGFLDQNEFTTGFGNVNYFNRWDADRGGWLSEDEFNRSLHGAWDTNANGVLAHNEYGEYADDGWF